MDIMIAINYVLQGFGFDNLTDFKKSAFGFMFSEKVIAGGSVVAFLTALADSIESLFGINHAFFTAYAILIIFEWFSGIGASRKRKEQHSSRKLGRMILKIAAYSIPLYVLNTFSKNIVFPIVFGYEVDPFTWLYYTVLMVIIWQLLVSLLENLDVLGVPFASKLLKIINKKFYSQLGLDDTHD